MTETGSRRDHYAPLGNERTMAYARWAGAAVALLQVAVYTPEPTSRSYILPGTLALAAALVAANLVLLPALRRGRIPRPLAAGMFGVDLAVVSAFVWLYLDEPAATQWVLFLIVQLEGAYRWDMRGAMGTALASSAFYAVVRAFAADEFGFAFDVSFVLYVAGIAIVQALVVGGMAKRLRAERDAQAELHEAALALTSTFERLAILDAIVAEARRVSGAEIAVLWTPDEDGFVAEAMDGFSSGDPPRVPMADPVYGESSVARAFRTRRTVRRGGSSDPQAPVAEALVLPSVWRAVCSIPLQGEPEPFGVLSCYADDVARDPEWDVRLEPLATLASLAMRNASAYERERSALDAMRGLDRLKDDFLSTLSHELRTPLTVVQGFATTLRSRWDDLADDRRRDLIGRIEGQATGLHERIGDLLEFSRLQSGAYELSPEDVDAARLVAETVSRMEPTLQPRTVEVEVPAGTRIWADPLALATVLENLLSNAARYSAPETTITVRGALGGDDFVELAVVDQGLGVPTGEQERIFERFYRGMSESVRAVRGTGVGLAIVQELVEAHGGSVRVESIPDEGSTFTIRLPATEEVARAQGVPAGTPSRTSRGAGS